MTYDAFTIDSNIPIRAGLKLDSGLLGQLSQFKHGPMKFVLSEIVIRELHKHLLVQVKKAHEELQSALTKSATSNLTKGDQAGWDTKFASLPDTATVAGGRLKGFLDATGAAFIKPNLASMDGLVVSYFENRAPFEPTGAKRHEFPDAIALLSLESWAKSENKRILAVSADKGWKAFAETSANIDVLDDLASALGLVQQHSEAAEVAIANWLRAASASTSGAAFVTLTDLLHTSLSETPFDAEGEGHLCRDGHGEDIQLTSFSVDQHNGNFDWSVVRLGSNEIVATVAFTIAANASASFSMAVWDSIDKEDVNMGYQSAEADVEFDSVALLTFSTASTDAGIEIELIEVEVLDGPGTVAFGEIEFDHDDDGYEDWYAEQQDSEVQPTPAPPPPAAPHPATENPDPSPI